MDENSEKNKQFIELLLKGDAKGVSQYIDEALEQGMSLQQLYTQVLGRAQCEIGQRWEDRTATIAQEHRATQILLDQLSRLRQTTRCRCPLAVKVVIASLPGDHHVVGGRMVADLFILDGWDVDFLGGDTPVDEISKHVKEVDAKLIGISVSDPAQFPTAKAAIESIRKQNKSVKIMIGGRAVMMKENEAKETGADVVVVCGAQATVEAKKALGLGNSSQVLFQTLGEIGGRIHHFRKSLKMSQEKLAQCAGLDRAYISSVENGKQNVTIGALLKLADAMGIELAELIVGRTSSESR